jgi:hypothetical protein
MGVYGKTKYDWKFRTLCDHGQPGRRRVISRHYSESAAKSGFARLKRYYSRFSDDGSRVLWRCWQEDRAGLVVQDTGAILWPVNR